MTDTVVLDSLVRRLKRLGIELEFVGNYPWIYIREVNGNKVIDRLLGNHGFTVAFLPRKGEKMELTDIGKIMKMIRKYRGTCPHIWEKSSICRADICTYPKCLK